MKKSIAVIIVIATLILLNVNTVFAVSSYNYDEITFSVEDYYTEMTDSDECDIRFVTYDDSIEFRFSQHNNFNETQLDHLDLQDAADVYIDLIYSGPEDYVFESITDSYFGYTDTLTVYGSVGDFNVETYIYMTPTYLYVFEFFVKPGSGNHYVLDVLDSVEFYDYNSSWDTDSSSDSFEFVETLAFIFPLALTVISLFGSFIFKKAKGKKAQADESDVASLINKLSAAVGTKFELNGKKINLINEKIATGSNDDNFALKELERERKEREKMFTKGE